MLNRANLPDDTDTPKAMREASLAALADRDAVIERTEDRIVRLEKLLADFKRPLFGHRSETSDPEQYELALEERAIGAPLVRAQWRGRRRLPQSTPDRFVFHLTLPHGSRQLLSHSPLGLNQWRTNGSFLQRQFKLFGIGLL